MGEPLEKYLQIFADEDNEENQPPNGGNEQTHLCAPTTTETADDPLQRKLKMEDNLCTPCDTYNEIQKRERRYELYMRVVAEEELTNVIMDEVALRTAREQDNDTNNEDGNADGPHHDEAMIHPKTSFPMHSSDIKICRVEHVGFLGAIILSIQ